MKLRIKSWMRYLLVINTTLSISCKKFVEVPPPVSSTNSENIYTTDATAIASITGIYTNISGSSLFSSSSLPALSLIPGLSADELSLYSGSVDPYYTAYYKNSLTATTGSFYNFWTGIYPIVYFCNSAIVGMSKNSSITPAINKQLMGEAKFLRAFCYFYLVNLFGDVPLVTGTDYSLNAKLPRTPKSLVYNQIVSDLRDAENLLSTNYLDGTLKKAVSERVRPTRWVASSLLARTYLFLGKYDSANIEASLVINNTSLYHIARVDSVFFKNNSEAIWQLQPVHVGQNTQDAIVFVLSSSGPDAGINQFYISSQLINAFEPNDLRKINWIGNVTTPDQTYYFPNKYKQNLANQVVSEYENVFRLSEQYLIRAEARVQLGDIAGAQSDINTVRARASLPPISQTSSTDLLALILHERQVELFSEWGHRWLDLKRTNVIDNVMGGPNGATSMKGGNWQSYQAYYPLPSTELNADPNLVQNEGYR